jgi:hypothetical protein
VRARRARRLPRAGAGRWGAAQRAVFGGRGGWRQGRGSAWVSGARGALQRGRELRRGRGRGAAGQWQFVGAVEGEVPNANWAAPLAGVGPAAWQRRLQRRVATAEPDPLPRRRAGGGSWLAGGVASNEAGSLCGPGAGRARPRGGNGPARGRARRAGGRERQGFKPLEGPRGPRLVSVTPVRGCWGKRPRARRGAAGEKSGGPRRRRRRHALAGAGRRTGARAGAAGGRLKVLRARRGGSPWLCA